MADTTQTRIDSAQVRMYRFGTGDCFTIKFMAGGEVRYTMMIDCGTIISEKAHSTPILTTLLDDLWDEDKKQAHVDVLVVTHEHLDHVSVFNQCKADFVSRNFTADRIWMAWTEADGKSDAETLKKEHGDLKKALGKAAKAMNNALADPKVQAATEDMHKGDKVFEAKQSFLDSLSGFAELHLGLKEGEYVGSLPGMEFVKTVLKGRTKTKQIEYYRPGDIIQNIPELDGIRMFVLGPPLTWEEIKQEEGPRGEAYQHNKDQGDAFAAAVFSMTGSAGSAPLPFDSRYATPAKDAQAYDKPGSEWRRIDDDWLLNAGPLALRINSITNNLSLALAMEFVDSGRVMLFPGDAEFGSWKSWHDVDFKIPRRKPDLPVMTDLLNRTVFFKVAHHMSHHGTAQRLGMDMIAATHTDLVAMVPLDRERISSQWLGTMPNRMLLNQLLERASGRVMVMNENGISCDKDGKIAVSQKLQEYRNRFPAEDKAFQARYEGHDSYLQYTVDGVGSKSLL